MKKKKDVSRRLETWLCYNSKSDEKCILSSKKND